MMITDIDINDATFVNYVQEAVVGVIDIIYADSGWQIRLKHNIFESPYRWDGYKVDIYSTNIAETTPKFLYRDTVG